jgi:hypothetical protein
MEQFIEKHRGHINGVLSGFDRLVFRGRLRGLDFSVLDKGNDRIAVGMETFLRSNGVLFKEYGDMARGISKRVKAASLKACDQAGRPSKYLWSPSVDKDAMARELAGENHEQGIACVLGATEPSPSFEHRRTHMVCRTRPCHVLYHYQTHPLFGWMYARIQTWFPFSIQVGINGREWLAWQMRAAGIKYLQQDNCFPWIQDWERAQQLMDSQLKTSWATVLNELAGQLNPLHGEIFQRYAASYYWTVYQSEWATDIVFQGQDHLKRLMPVLVRHGMLSHSSADVMRFMGGQVNRSGEIPKRYRGELETDMKRRVEGERVKFAMNGNSVKFYDKAYTAVGSVLRAAETTINNAGAFRCYRPKEGDRRAEAGGGGQATDLTAAAATPEPAAPHPQQSDPACAAREQSAPAQPATSEAGLAWRKMRKGVADLHRRAGISQKANERVIDALARADDSRAVEEITRNIHQPTTFAGRRVRPVRPWGPDKELLKAVNDGRFFLPGFRNRDIHALLHEPTKATVEATEVDRQKTAIRRQLRILRAHHLIVKIPRTHRYNVTSEGRSILIALLTAAQATVNQLNQLNL